MAIVKIPSTANPFRVIVNGVEYIYAAGETVDVPEAVATVIEQYIDAAEDMAAAPELPQGSTALGGADWNAKEGQPGHVLNRTHYTEVAVGEILPETALEIYPEEGMGVLTEPVLSLIIGEEYTVVWNGTEYKCVAQEIPEDGMSVTILGNLVVIDGADSGEPFGILCASAEAAAQAGVSVVIYPLDGSTSVTVSVSGPVETVHKLDSKYLPIQSSGQAMLITLTYDGSGGLFVDKSYEQICAHIRAGGDAYVSASIDDDNSIQYRLIGNTETEVRFGVWTITSSTLDIQTISIDSTNAVSMAAYGVNIDAFN